MSANQSNKLQIMLALIALAGTIMAALIPEIGNVITTLINKKEVKKIPVQRTPFSELPSPTLSPTPSPTSSLVTANFQNFFNDVPKDRVKYLEVGTPVYTVIGINQTKDELIGNVLKDDRQVIGSVIFYYVPNNQIFKLKLF